MDFPLSIGVDTIGFRYDGQLSGAVRVAWERHESVVIIPKGWKMRLRKQGFYIDGSLSRFNRGRLPTSDEELYRSLEDAKAEIRAMNGGYFDGERLVRVDLARDCLQPTGPLIEACKDWKLKGFYNLPIVRKNGITWTGNHNQFIVKLYDASKKHKVPAATRLEATFRGRSIFKNGILVPLRMGNLGDILQRLAEYLPDHPTDLNSRKLSIGKACAQHGVEFGSEAGLHMLRLLSKNVTRQTAARYRRDYAAGYQPVDGLSPRKTFALASP